MVRFCLNGIVKDEGARIERMLDSVGHFIDYVVLVDTGSTDDTKKKIRDWCALHHIPCQLFDAPFENWSQARNAALAHGRKVWCDTQAFDYFLLVDADMQLVVKDRTVFDGLTGPSYDVYQYAGSVHYQNRRLLRADYPGQYLGVTHEYLDVPTAGCLSEKAIHFIDHADGANRPEKFKRDIRLLLQGLEDEPRNERYMFYLANSYRDAGMPEKAMYWYKERVRAGGWDEEVWAAQCSYAACLKALGDEDGFITETLAAYQMRPSRAETLYDLARYHREKGENVLAAMYAREGLDIPLSKDALFVNDMVYKVGLLEELGITGYYAGAPMQRAGFEATDRLSLMRTPYTNARETARNNMFFYLKPLVEYCPSFTSGKIDWTPPDEGWACLNPSIVSWGSTTVLMNMRTVNYRMDEQGRYLIRGVEDDGKLGCNATTDNPIVTRNFLLELQPAVTMKPLCWQEPAMPDLPCKFPLVKGFEDVRLFFWHEQLWASATVRQIEVDGQCEQVRARIRNWEGFERGGARFTDVHRMLRTSRLTEKNWSPWVVATQKLYFMYSPGHVVDENGADLCITDTGLASYDLRGGTQVIPFGAGFLSIVHEARQLPGSHKRYYWHRFVLYNYAGALERVSAPFVFNDRVIEFAAGLCRLGSTLWISYGSKDEEAHLASVSVGDVAKFLGVR